MIAARKLMSDADRATIVALKGNKLTSRQIADRVGFSHHAVQKFITRHNKGEWPRVALAEVVAFTSTQAEPRERHDTLGEALIAHAGGCHWPMQSDDGVCYCGARRLSRTVNNRPALTSYCAEHYLQSVQRRVR